MGPVNITHAIELREGEQKALEAANIGGFKPAPLFYLLNAFCDQRNLQIGAAADYRLHNRLLGPAQVDIADDLSVDFELIRLKPGEQ